MKSVSMEVIVQALSCLVSVAAVHAAESDYGAAAVSVALSQEASFTVNDMLHWAAEDEYLAHGEYAAIINKFGSMRPYTNIMAAEAQHLSWLRDEYKSRGLSFPSDQSAAHVVVPMDLKSAAQTGVDTEIANIAMYESFLSRPELSRPENATVKDLFERLMRASENHLKAFKNQLFRY